MDEQLQRQGATQNSVTPSTAVASPSGPVTPDDVGLLEPGIEFGPGRQHKWFLVGEAQGDNALRPGLDLEAGLDPVVATFEVG